MGHGIIQTSAVVIQADSAQDRGVDPVTQMNFLTGDPGQLCGQLFLLGGVQGDSGNGGNTEDTVVFVVRSLLIEYSM